MAFNPKNYVDGVGPVVSAAWLNGVDITINQALQGVTTTAQLIALVGGGGGGSPGVNAITLVATTPAIVVQASNTGTVADFSSANGQAKLFNGTTDVSELAVWGVVLNGCTATVNTSDGVPVAGRPIGYYTFTGLPANTGSATITALYQGITYITTISITKSLAGSTGPAGTPGTPGTPGAPGAPGAGGITIVLSSASATVLTFADGSVPSFAGLNGKASVLNAGVDVSESATWSVVLNGCTGTVNTADGVPVLGQLIGFYQMTGITQAIATMKITAIYLGNTLTATYQVTQVPTGYQIVSSLPVTNLFEGRIVFLSTDGQLYRFHGGVWTTAVPAVNITGLLSAAQIASVAASQITGALTAAQIASITAAQITGTITTTQITPGAITTPLLAAGAVNTAALAAGSVTASTIASGTITAAQIAAGTITGANIAAGTILAGNIAAGTITAGQLAANSVTATQISANSITTNAIQAGAVTAAQIGVTQLSAIAANIGTVTAGLLQNSSGNALLDLNNAWLVFTNGVNMLVRGLGFGTANNYLDWFGPSLSSTGNFAGCNDTNAIYYLKTDGTYKFGTALQASATTLFNNAAGGTFGFTIPAGKTQMIVELFGDTGLGGHGDGSTPGGGGGSGGYCKSVFSIVGKQTQTLVIFLGQGNTQPTSSTVTGGTFSMATMNAIGGVGGTVGPGGAAGAGGSASGGNLINQDGNSGGNANGTKLRGPGIAGQYGNGNPGGAGAVSATTNNPGLAAICAVTVL